jgi:LysR family transcriptional regulator, glycine cleavage system transcriptional activator
MLRKLPPLNALKAFEAAGRNQSFTIAGNELGVTHGAISRQVQALEHWLGLKLFRRFNRRLELTEAGQRYLTETGPLLDRLSQVSLRLRDERGVRVLRVNALATFAIRWLIPRLSSFQRRHPYLEVRLSTSNEKLNRLLEPYDIAIRGGPDRYRDHVSGSFLEESRLPVCSPELLKREPLPAPAALAAHTLIHSGTLPGAWKDWLDMAGLPGLKPVKTLTFEHFYLSLEAALGGLGVALGPSSLVAGDIGEGKLIAPFPSLALPARPYYWYCSIEKASDDAVIAFRDWLADASTVS